MKPLPFDAAVAAQPLLEAGLDVRWVAPEEWPFAWMRGMCGFVLAGPVARLTDAQRRAARACGGHCIRLGDRDYVVVEIESERILGAKRARPNNPSDLGMETLYFGDGQSYAPEDETWYRASHESHMRTRDRWWKSHGHFGDYRLWLAMLDDATTRRFLLWWFLLRENWNRSRA